MKSQKTTKKKTVKKITPKKTETSKKSVAAKTSAASKVSLRKFRPTIKLGREQLPRIITTFALVIFLASGIVWWRQVRNDPERIFWNAINNALQTRSVTRRTERNVDTQQPDQFLQLQTAPNAGVRGLNKYYQSGDNSEPSLVTEVIGLPEADFIRVLALVSSNPTAPNPDISEFRGKWANASQGGQGSGQLYSQMVLGIVPFGSLNSDQRSSLIRTMKEKNIYKVDYDTFQKVKDQGRTAYGYNVSVNTEAYVRMLQEFARQIGVKQLEGLDPAQYADAPALEFQLIVDPLSQQFIAVRQQGGEVMRLTAYGLKSETIKAPEDVIPLQELQQKLQAIGQ
jgi:hypothetical protein